MSDSSSEHSDSDAVSGTPFANVRFLSPDVERLRAELIKLLKRKQLDSEHLIKLVQPYGDDVVQKALPYVMKRLIDKKDKDQSRAAVLREAIQNLETDHNFHFKWNPLYQCFLQGRPVPQRTTEADLSYIKTFFGETYREDLELGPFRGQDESKCSKLRELRPLVLLVEQLNLEVEEVKAYILAVRDARIQHKRRGRLNTVTGGDLQQVKEELQSLVWTTLKRSRTSVTAPFAKRAKVLSKEFIDEEASQAESASDQHPEEQVGKERSPSRDEETPPSPIFPSQSISRQQPLEGRKLRQNHDEGSPDEPQRYKQISPDSRQRTTHKVPKGAGDLWRLRTLSLGVPSGNVSFGGWFNSAYVHGHGKHGHFFYNDNYGSISATRLVGFHDQMKRQYQKDYLHSWIVLPHASPKLQQATWIAVTQLLSHRQFESMDGNLSRRPEGSMRIEEDL